LSANLYFTSPNGLCSLIYPQLPPKYFCTHFTCLCCRFSHVSLVAKSLIAWELLGHKAIEWKIKYKSWRSRNNFPIKYKKVTNLQELLYFLIISTRCDLWTLTKQIVHFVRTQAKDIRIYSYIFSITYLCRTAAFF